MYAELNLMQQHIVHHERRIEELGLADGHLNVMVESLGTAYTQLLPPWRITRRIQMPQTCRDGSAPLADQMAYPVRIHMEVSEFARGASEGSAGA